jgi:hypothetical protein
MRVRAWLPGAMVMMTCGFAAAQSGAPATRDIVAAAAAYVAEYQQQLTSVLADERYAQEIVTQVPRAPDMPRRRVLASEVFFLFAPSGREWMTIRDVTAVDGRAVAQRPDLQQALRTLAPREVAATFKSYNSRFNLGRTYRNFNEPTLSLLVLDAEHRSRFSFDRARVERDGEAVLVTLAFKEKESPTLIRDVNRGRIFSTGTLVVEAATGRVRRATLNAKSGGIRIELTTEYGPDARLGIWVPVTFREHYTAGSEGSSKAGGPQYEEIACEAAYSNFRRFETSARIK